MLHPVVGSCLDDRKIDVLLKRLGEDGDSSPGEDDEGVSSDVVPLHAKPRNEDQIRSSERTNNCPT